MKNKTIKKITTFLSGQPSTEWTHESKLSVYYNIGKKKIRISDHLPRTYKEDLNVIVPYNYTGSFIIFINRTPLIIKSYEELTNFLRQYILIEHARKLSK